MAKKPKTTTRSYTLGLLSTSDASDWLPLWSRLFQTHHAVCRGAREYGEFYLNLRGGLAASLADCADEPDAERRRLLQRGARRMLALGWFSVESVRGAEHHPHRVRERVCAACNSLPKPSCEHGHPDKVSELKPGQSLPPDLAQRLLREILTTHKSVIEEAALAEWASDCVLALTAHIRPDAVIVNRAAVFAEWQKSVGDAGAEMPEQARRILFAMCGDGFASLTLPEEDAVKQDDEQADTDSTGADDTEGEDAGKAKGEADDAEPSNASRGVFGDLFGGDAAAKVSRAAGKEEFAVNVRAMLAELDAPPTRETIVSFRQQQGLPELDISKPDKYPKEVSSSGAPTAVAKRYRKLLVGLNLWPKSDEESGLSRTQAVSSFGNRVTTQDERSRNAHINALDLIDACPEPTKSNDGEPDAAPTSARVFTPPWAPALAERVAAATNMPVNAKPLNEFKRLMFALAARRISQTQTWTKRNEAERHKAAVKEDAAKKKLEELDPDGSARAWFSAYEEKRGDDSQASSDFRITRRMIGECDAVFKAWQGAESADEREEKTASVQAKAEKFGDARLYADLSEDPAATAIWRHEQGAEILKQWVKLRQAQNDQQRLKIPRFCHPDPFHHPTWCEFGGSSKPKVWYAWKPDSEPQSPEPGGDADGSRRLWMLLPDFGARQAKAVPMRWRSKRLSQDLGGVRGHTEVSVPRADRLSLAAAKLPLLNANKEPIRYRPEHPFTKDAKGWNARLQLDRDTLERLERYWDDDRREWRDDGKALRNARWFVTFAPALAASDGPERGKHPKLGWKPKLHSDLNKKREGHAKLVLSRLPDLRVLSVDLGHRYAAACAVWETPDAATFDIRKVIANAKAKGWKVDGSAEGLFVHIHEPTSKIAKNGRNKGKPVVETTIYRRVGEDSLRDPKTGKPTTTPHPAPWARLDRQFLIKLQGEEKPARMASEDEYKQAQRLEESLGRLRDEDAPLPWRVDDLMSEAVRSVRLALRRHGDAARIAYAFMPGSQRHAPGGGTSEHTSESRQGVILDALMRWHDLCGDDARSRWRDPKAAAAWKKHIRPRIAPELPTLAEDADRFDRKRHRATLEKALKSVVHTLAESGDAGNPTLHNEWKRIWEEANGEAAVVPKVENGQKGPAETEVVKGATGWHGRIRSLADWIMPSGMHARRNETQSEMYARKSRLGSARNVGGLSLTRIATIRELWQIQKAYRYKAKPDDPRAGIKLMEDDSAKGYKFGDRVLQTMERMREQRVKQIASRIAASALGLGGHWKDVERRDHKGKPIPGKDGKPRMKRVWVEEPSPKYPACHAVVIEDLRNYRPDELQTRRENKALMVWSAGKVRKYLEEACQLHGLHLRQLQPNYTSQQDSRTGFPGVRCQDVPVDRATGEVSAFWWKKAHSGAAKKVNDGKKEAEAHLLVELDSHLKKLANDGQPVPPTVRLPRRGGDLFVAALPQSCRANGHRSCSLCDGKRSLQADLNAAANIGLRALLDPDFSGKWWYIPCIEDKAAGTAMPRADKAKGSACFGPDPAKPEQFGSLMAVKAPQNQDGKAGKRKRGSSAEGKETTNFWCDPGVLDLRAAANNGFWMATPAYWKWVRKRAVAVLWDNNGLGQQGELGLAPDDES